MKESLMRQALQVWGTESQLDMVIEDIGQQEEDAPSVRVVDVKTGEVVEAPQRDPATIKNTGELQKALFEDFKLQPKQQLAELNIDSWNELTISPKEAYSQVVATRK